ncbi:hypothetical protein OROGR_030403 [Orobanche gracilis]
MTYMDFGDASFTCYHCNAIMWYEERSEKSKQSNNPDFSLCFMKGKVDIHFLQKPLELLHNLITGVDPRSKHFKDNIRPYNNMFSFTSIGGKVDTTLNDGNGPPNFILSGQNYHIIGSLLPPEGVPPKFAQLYIYDTPNEIDNRMRFFSGFGGKYVTDRSLVEDLTKMVDHENHLAKLFRRVRDAVNQNPVVERWFRVKVLTLGNL